MRRAEPQASSSDRAGRAFDEGDAHLHWPRNVGGQRPTWTLPRVRCANRPKTQDHHRDELAILVYSRAMGVHPGKKRKTLAIGID